MPTLNKNFFLRFPIHYGLLSFHCHTIKIISTGLIISGKKHPKFTFLRELTFYPVLDFLLMLLDTHIAHKDVLFFHDLISCADLDFLFLLLDNHIAHKIFFSTINRSFVFISTSFFCCLILTLPARIFYSFVNCSSML